MTEMILEGLVTTIAPDGTLNLAPMGPIVEPSMRKLILRPFNTSHTYRNLKDHGEGVFHVTDDVLLLAQGAIGTIDPLPPLERATAILGYVVTDACRYYEFRVTRIDDTNERTTMEAEVVHDGTLRDFFGFNRAKHLVLEAAILATRTAFLPLDEIMADFRRWEVVVAKTGGEREKEAFALLKRHVECEMERRPSQAGGR
jgi:hypothetical protein